MKNGIKNGPSAGRHQPAAKRVATMELVITNRASVPAALYEEVKANITWMLPYLHRHDNLVPEDLVGLGFWCDLDEAEQRMVRACIAHMSQVGVLPISPCDAVPESTHFYVLG